MNIYRSMYHAKTPEGIEKNFILIYNLLKYNKQKGILLWEKKKKAVKSL